MLAEVFVRDNIVMLHHCLPYLQNKLKIKSENNEKIEDLRGEKHEEL